MRLFVALPVADQARERLAAEVDRWRGLRDGRGADWRWTRPESWHVTLAFLGEVEDHAVPDVVREVATGTTGARTLRLALGDVGRFGRRVLHVGVDDRPVGAVAALGGAIQRALAEAGLPVQEREVRAHLTLARAGRRTIDRAPDLEVPNASWAADDVLLMSSTPGRGGSRYEVVERFPLD